MSSVSKEDSNGTSESCCREQTLLLMLSWTTFVPQLSPTRKCTENDCGCTHNTFLHGAERIFPGKPESGKESNGETSNTTCSVTTATQKKNEVTSRLPSGSDVKGLLQITEVDLQTSEKSGEVLILFDSATQRVVNLGFLLNWLANLTCPAHLPS